VVFFVAFKQLPGCSDGWTAIGAEASMAAVVEDDVGGRSLAFEAVDGACEALRDCIGGRRFPVRGDGIPGDRDHSQIACGAEDKRAARAERGAEKADTFTQDVLERVAGSCEFLGHLLRRGQRQVGVAPGVIADEMARCGDAPHKRGLGLGKAANHEECRLYIVLCKQVNQLGSPRGIGAVIEGEREFAWFAGSGQRFAEELRIWP